MKLFFAILALTAASFAQISNGSNQNYTNSQGVRWQVKSVYDVRDSGVDCTGVNDSTTALQTLINNVPNFSTILFPQACKVKVSGSPAITIDQRYGLVFDFGGRQGNNCDEPTGTAAQLNYATSYSAGNKILYINRSQRLHFKGLTIITNGGADVALDVDQVGATPPITTMNVFDDVCIRNQAAARSTFVGMRFSATSTANVEAMHLYRPFVLCSSSTATSTTSNGTGILFGPGSSNAVDEIVEDPNFNKCSVDVNTGLGQANFWKNGLSSASFANVMLSGFIDGVDGLRSENATTAINIANPIGPHLITNTWFGASLGTRIDCPQGCGKVTMFNNHTDSVPTSWFDVHGNPGASGPLVAFNNRNFSWTSTDWDHGAFVIDPDITTSTNTHFLLTPSYASGNNRGGNIQSPALDFMTLSGTSVVQDNFVLQALPTGPLSNTPGSTTFAIGHANASALTPWLAFAGKQGGANFAQMGNTGNLGVVVLGTPGTTSYSYQVIAHSATGVTGPSNTATATTGNAVLSAGNRISIQIPMVAGCTYFDVYRTASAGTPATTGKIATHDCYTTQLIPTENASILAVTDTGLAGDGTTPPTVNTTGAVNAISAFIATPASSTVHPFQVQIQGANDIIKARAATSNSQQLIFGACYSSSDPIIPGTDGARQIACSTSADVIIGRFQAGSAAFVNSVVQAQSQTAAGTTWKLFSGRAGVSADGTIGTGAEVFVVNGQGDVSGNSLTTAGTNGGISGTEGTGAGVPAGAGLDVMWPDSTAHRWKMNNNNSATSPSVAGTYPSGSVTTAGTAVGSGTCQAQTGITVTGALTTDNVVANIGATLPATWQTGIQLSAHVTAGGTVTVYLCNPSAGSITPAATAVFVRILR